MRDYGLNLYLLKVVTSAQENDERGESLSLKTVRWVLWGAVALAAVGLYFAPSWRENFSGTQGVGETSVFRADFELTDHQGTVRTDEDFAGKWLLVFFGFTNCPDICPTTLAEVATVMDDLGPQADRVQPLFISVDPERDTPIQLADFVPRFHPAIIGLTGTPDQIMRTGASFKIYYEKITEAAAPDGYTMAHSSQLFLFDPQGGYVKAFAYGTPAEEILANVDGRL